jgi:hypothetical protein
VNTVVIAFIGQSQNFEVTQEMVTISCLFVLACFVYQPNAIQAILPAVIADPEFPTRFFSP